MGDFSLAFDGPPPVANLPISLEKPGARARALVNEHFDFVWRLLRRLGVPEADVDDAGSERTFLYGTALRIAATTRRNLRRRERFIQSVVAETEGSARTPHDELERRRALSFLDTVLQALDDDQRVVFVLCEIEELSAPQVASLVGIPIGTVASRLRRARQAFAEELKRLKAQGT